ncbi:hypothetical protein OG599_12530 [Streptomyces sp. NBC_01335]|uniref:hypothetical protein n=1 Tax=Streptomyces sp. NBC_01335 TaxID=2903828 RepID=UPI002E0F8199|nr:hypothetical protein OG599_12530 [Streptomyces sp. NBC_01335]
MSLVMEAAGELGPAVTLLGERMARRFSAAVARLGAGHPVYLHDGRADWSG